nr:hypothetical protein HUO10_004191 [Paraburkholderia busanensis]
MLVLAHFPLQQTYPRDDRTSGAAAGGCAAACSDAGAVRVCDRPHVWLTCIAPCPRSTAQVHEHSLAWGLLFPRSRVAAAYGADRRRMKQQTAERGRQPATGAVKSIATRTAIKTTNADDDTTLISTGGRRRSVHARHPLLRHRLPTHSTRVECVHAAHGVAWLDPFKESNAWPAYPFSFFRRRSFRNDGSKQWFKNSA